MTIASYRSLIRRIDRQRVGSLEQFLVIPLSPMVLSDMNRLEKRGEFIMRSVQQLVARTSRCYEAFSYPVMSNSLRLHNAERLKWIQTKSLREFKQCLVLQELAKEYVSSGKHLKVASAFPSHSTPNTAPDSLVNASDRVSHTLSGTKESPLPSEYASVSEKNESVVLQGSSGLYPEPITEEPVLDREELDLENLSFELALELLRPRDSILNVLFNEASIRSDLLNDWFYYYCQQRVAWRVLHEHLLHLTRPGLYPRVVYDDVQLLDLLQTVGNIVAEIYANLAVGEKDLTIHVEEDGSILEHPPPSQNFVGSSSSTPLEDRHFLDISQHLSSSATIYAVKDHLLYVFRELIKNACAATVRWSTDISILVKFATNDKWVVVEFIDHAGGINPQHTKHIWKFGWTTHKYHEGHFGGFGVGLPISKVYMDMWNGTIDVYSVFNKGSTVRIRFPKSPTEVLASSAKLSAT